MKAIFSDWTHPQTPDDAINSLSNVSYILLFLSDTLDFNEDRDKEITMGPDAIEGLNCLLLTLASVVDIAGDILYKNANNKEEVA